MIRQMAESPSNGIDEPVLEYRRPQARGNGAETDHAAVARRVYDQMSQEAPPSAVAGWVWRVLSIAAVVFAVATIVATLALVWRATAGGPGP